LLNRIATLIREADNIAILPHLSADGDAIGSSFALAIALAGMKKNVKVYLEEEIPSIFKFLPGSNLSIVFAEETDIQFDVAVALDCGDMDRLGKRKGIYDRSKATVNIDHHPTNTNFAQYNYTDMKASATAEIVFSLLKLLDIENNKEIATNLYTAITTDTGGFRYSNTTSHTHNIAAELIKSGVDVAHVSEKVFDSVSYEKVKLLGEAINVLELMEDGKIAAIVLSRAIVEKTGAKEDDFDGIINTAKNIRGVEVAFMMRQNANGEIKVSLRSGSLVDVSEIARAYSGGGHKKAAGYTASGTLEDARNRLVNDIRKALLK